LAGETEVFGKTLLYCHTVYNKCNKHDLAWDQTLAAMVRNQQLSFGAMTWKSLYLKLGILITKYYNRNCYK
jgi:hypothetical protein